MAVSACAPAPRPRQAPSSSWIQARISTGSRARGASTRRRRRARLAGRELGQHAAQRGTAAEAQRHRLAEARGAAVGVQSQDDHLARVELAARGPVPLPEGERDRDRFESDDAHAERQDAAAVSRLRAAAGPLRAPGRSRRPPRRRRAGRRSAARAAFSAGPSVRLRTARIGLAASGIVIRATSAGAQRVAGDQHQRQQQVGGDDHPGVEVPGPLAAEPHRERALAGAAVGVDVADVVDDEDRRREQADRDREQERRQVELLELHVVGAVDGDEPEEDEDEDLAEALVAVGLRAARVEDAGGDREHADGDDDRADLDRQVEAGERGDAERGPGRVEDALRGARGRRR